MKTVILTIQDELKVIYPVLDSGIKTVTDDKIIEEAFRYEF